MNEIHTENQMMLGNEIFNPQKESYNFRLYGRMIKSHGPHSKLEKFYRGEMRKILGIFRENFQFSYETGVEMTTFDLRDKKMRKTMLDPKNIALEMSLVKDNRELLNLLNPNSAQYRDITNKLEYHKRVLTTLLSNSGFTEEDIEGLIETQNE